MSEVYLQRTYFIFMDVGQSGSAALEEFCASHPKAVVTQVSCDGFVVVPGSGKHWGDLGSERRNCLTVHVWERQ